MIQIRGLKKRFGPKVVLDGVDLEIERGETRVVIGRSGEGKSVLLKHIIGLLEPDAGSVEVDGIRLDWRKKASLASVRSIVGMLFQGAALFDSLNVRDNVAFALIEHGKLSADEIDRVVERMLELVNLPGIQHLSPAELSGGMKKRVGLARALASNPKVMLYDEPTTGLDPINADVINKLIRDMQRKLGMTSIVVTHDMTSAFEVGDRISMLHQGRIIETGTPEEIRSSSNPIVRQFVLGTSEGPVEAEPVPAR
ncbi:MAG: ABC transporter ATP-binding protein [Candidatus Sumerlaeia bacterium]|nr:ABC transporter ATP-binding protein [Candidatus Sumerlaeia bacterium]